MCRLATQVKAKDRETEMAKIRDGGDNWEGEGLQTSPVTQTKGQECIFPR